MEKERAKLNDDIKNLKNQLDGLNNEVGRQKQQNDKLNHKLNNPPPPTSLP